MFSYSHHLKSGHIMCYFDRKFDVLTTIPPLGVDHMCPSRHNGPTEWRTEPKHAQTEPSHLGRAWVSQANARAPEVTYWAYSLPWHSSAQPATMTGAAQKKPRLGQPGQVENCLGGSVPVLFLKRLLFVLVECLTPYQKALQRRTGMRTRPFGLRY
jgi:hypothetical protein